LRNCITKKSSSRCFCRPIDHIYNIVYTPHAHEHMKLINLFLFALILIVLISFTTIGSSTYVPYVKDMLFSHMYPYEGFKSFKNTPSEYSTYPKNDAMDSKTSFAIDDSQSAPQCHKVMGFNGLYCPSKIEGDPANPGDIFSKADGNWKCESYGLMNSRGYLCLDDNMKKMLTSRGGNA
jgi:hypothetical protein